MTLPENVVEILRSCSPATRVAVVGASNNPDKYGNIIVRNLVERQFTVLPVNRSEASIAGLPAWSDVSLVPDPVHLVSFVTPPAVTLNVLESMKPGRFPVVWFQDGAWDEACVEAARSRAATVVYNACILVALRTFGHSLD